MERNTKVVVLTGPSNCGKTTTLGKVSEYLQQKEGFSCLSNKVFGGKMNDISDLLQSKDGKLVYIMSEGDYQRDLRWGEMFVLFSVCDVYVCACSDKFREKFARFLSQAKIFEKNINKSIETQDEINTKDSIEIVHYVKEVLL